MNRFILKEILRPFTLKWTKGVLLLLLWTMAFVALPAISGWFLAMSSLVFITANTTFSYLIPSAVIRLLALSRTATRYFEKLENHKTTLDVQHRLQLKIFSSVARFAYFRKQADNNAKLLENSTHGVEQILNHMLLWLLPLIGSIAAMVLLAFFLSGYAVPIGLYFLLSSALVLFVIPQFIFQRNKQLYRNLKMQREENQQLLLESFRGRIEISKYHLQQKVIEQYKQKLSKLEKTEKKLQTNSYYLQLTVGLGLGIVATFILWQSNLYDINAQTAIGIFFGIMAQAELAEMLFSGKSERNSVTQQIAQIQTIFDENKQSTNPITISENLQEIEIAQWQAKIPETTVETNTISLQIKKGEWIALFGETGKGKTTLLNSLFYPEYRKSGTLVWNQNTIEHLVPPQCIYITQKAYLLTGSLRENFQDYADEEILLVLKIVDLSGWLQSLPNGLDTWLGENGETLSGGQRKKLLLAQALLKKPQLLVIDEPTAGISKENAIEIFQSIQKQHPEMAILMATHLRELEQLADKSVFL